MEDAIKNRLNEINHKTGLIENELFYLHLSLGFDKNGEEFYKFIITESYDFFYLIFKPKYYILMDFSFYGEGKVNENIKEKLKFLLSSGAGEELNTNKRVNIRDIDEFGVFDISFKNNSKSYYYDAKHITLPKKLNLFKILNENNVALTLWMKSYIK